MKFKSILVLWPSFVVAGFMNCVFFVLFDPLELIINGAPLFETRTAAYSAGFFLFWAFTAFSSSLTLFFERDRGAVNRFCPVHFDSNSTGAGPMQHNTQMGS